MSMEKIANFAQWRRAKRAVFSYLEEHDLPQETFAAMLGTTRAGFRVAIGGASGSWSHYRMRLLIERLTGGLLWHTEREHAELGEIGRRIGLDLLTADLRSISKASGRAGAKIPRPMDLNGLSLFRALLTHFFPTSETLKTAPYEQTAEP